MIEVPFPLRSISGRAKDPKLVQLVTYAKPPRAVVLPSA